MKQPDLEKEEFLEMYRFLRVPKIWAGESFTKLHVLMYLLMKNIDSNIYKLYEYVYTVNGSTKFIKHAWEGISLKGRELIIEDEDALVESIIAYDNRDEKDLEINIKFEEELSNDSKVKDKILELQQKAIERGWKILC